VTGFVRKGYTSSPSSREAPVYHYVGVQFASAEAFRHLSDGEPVNSIGRVYDAWMAERPGAIRGFVSDASFADVGTASDYVRTSLECAAAESGGVLRVGRGSVIDPRAHLTRTIVWDDVMIDAGCVLDDCIVTDHVRVPAGSVFRRQILINNGAGRLAASSYD
jgi:NDP-sugar pyrophosphorylase family protein